MMRSIVLQLFLLLSVAALIGCSQAAALSSPGIDPPVRDVNQSHNLMGLYTFACDPDSGSIDIVAPRETGLHLNALKFLEPPPYLYLTLESAPKFNGNVLDVDIGLRHPFYGQLIYSGFDVCGIVFTRGSVTGFADPEIIMAGDGDTRLLNADGYTRWWNPTEFPHVETIFGYKDGLLGTPDEIADFNCTVNGYKYFADGLEPDDPVTAIDQAKRGLFAAGQKNIRHYTIDMSGGLIFNYAVDACWAFPLGNPPYEIPGDFPEKANRPEAYFISVTELENNLYYSDEIGHGGGTLSLLIDVWDHFDAGLNLVAGESLAGLQFTSTSTPVGGGYGYSTYQLDLTGEKLSMDGDAELLITIQSETADYGGLLPGKPVCAYFKHIFFIKKPLGWAKTWGSEIVPPPGSFPSYYSNVDEHGNATKIDASGDIIVGGQFTGTVDFDEGPGEDIHTSNGYLDAYMVKYDPSGHLLWTLTWGGIYYDRCWAIAVDNLNNIYAVGDFMGTVDFDPGPGVVELESFNHNSHDGYIVKFNSDGGLLWAKAWSCSNQFEPWVIEFDDLGFLYTAGEFHGVADFDLGPGSSYQTCGGGWFDAYLTKLDADGNLIWARTWGGSDSGRVNAMDIDFDSLGDVYVSGTFELTADFDPGPEIVAYTTINMGDSALSKFDSDGNFQWVRVWGNTAGHDHAYGLCVSSTDGIYVSGRYVGTVDFDTGPGLYELTSCSGSADCFISRFDTSGNWLWTLNWGGDGLDVVRHVSLDNNDNIYVCGGYSQTVDFDPGPGLVTYNSTGGQDAFLSKFQPDGILIWARAWGGKDDGTLSDDRGLYLDVDHLLNIYITGQFEMIADLDPGPGFDNHESKGGTDSFLVKIPPDGNW